MYKIVKITDLKGRCIKSAIDGRFVIDWFNIKLIEGNILVLEIKKGIKSEFFKISFLQNINESEKYIEILTDKCFIILEKIYIDLKELDA